MTTPNPFPLMFLVFDLNGTLADVLHDILFSGAGIPLHLAKRANKALAEWEAGEMIVLVDHSDRIRAAYVAGSTATLMHVMNPDKYPRPDVEAYLAKLNDKPTDAGE
jgi:phosphoglycolate phosphatase-like HAD superfamily hydrolase